MYYVVYYVHAMYLFIPDTYIYDNIYIIIYNYVHTTVSYNMLYVM
jgi:hypothetical protein